MTFEPQVIDAVVMIDDEIIATVEDNSEVFDAETDVVVVHSEVLPYYTGEYEVDPTFSSHTLETKNKSMSDDVTINAIAVQSVTNPSGGNTIFIGMI